MATIIDLVYAIDELNACFGVTDEATRFVAEGSVLDSNARLKLLNIFNFADELDISAPILRSTESNEAIEIVDLPSDAFDGEPWQMVIGKTPIADCLKARDDEKTLVFFSVASFHQWLRDIDPFSYPSSATPDLCLTTTIRVKGLNEGFGGPQLWVLPIESNSPKVERIDFPVSADVHSLIHTNAAKPLRVCPKAFALTWGKLDSFQAGPLVQLSARVLSACLVQELRCVDNRYQATLQGTKRLSLKLFENDQPVSHQLLKWLVKTVCWVYEERAETRLGLVMDRLSIDIEREETLLSGMEKHLEVALYQARDSYAFVILERKDAYHKEVRELMKDMKAQADLYAAKVRDLVNALTRDALGILFFMAFSFVGRFDKQNFISLLESSEMALLAKMLAGYLAFSFIFQCLAHVRDVHLADEESKSWLNVLQHYSSQDDRKNRFLNPISKRRKTFYIALVVAGVTYGVLVLATWNLPGIVTSLLLYESSAVVSQKS